MSFEKYFLQNLRLYALQMSLDIIVLGKINPEFLKITISGKNSRKLGLQLMSLKKYLSKVPEFLKMLISPEKSFQKINT